MSENLSAHLVFLAGSGNASNEAGPVERVGMIVVTWQEFAAGVEFP